MLVYWLNRWPYQHFAYGKQYVSNTANIPQKLLNVHILSLFDWQHVSDITLKVLMEGSLITSVPTTNREWVTLHILWKTDSSCPLTNREWVTWHILWRAVWTSKYFPMANSTSVTLHILLTSHLFQWPIGCEWHCTCCVKDSLITSLPIQVVSDIVHCVKGSHLMTSFPMTKSKWVKLHILWRQSHHIFSYDQ